MDFQTIALYAGGILTIVVAIMHVGLPLIMEWYREIKDLSPQARKTIVDRNSFLILLLLVIAFLMFAHPEELQNTNMGRSLLLIMGFYWFLRAIWRFFGYPSGAVRAIVSIIYLITGICFVIPLIF